MALNAGVANLPQFACMIESRLLAQVAQLKYGKLPQLEKELKEAEAQFAKRENSARLIQEEVTPDEIAEVVSRWTGVPVSRLLEGEKEKLLRQ